MSCRSWERPVTRPGVIVLSFRPNTPRHEIPANDRTLVCIASYRADQADGLLVTLFSRACFVIRPIHRELWHRHRNWLLPYQLCRRTQRIERVILFLFLRTEMHAYIHIHITYIMLYQSLWTISSALVPYRAQNETHSGQCISVVSMTFIAVPV